VRDERTADVVIVGGGVIGCAIARRAARGGLSVVVVERATPGMEASWAAAGMLSPLAEANGPGPFLDLRSPSGGSAWTDGSTRARPGSG
jgi:glycine oxidase